jgi:hypothetical protein
MAGTLAHLGLTFSHDQGRNLFVLVLVDGDGYIFQSKFFQNKESGGAEAAQQLLSDVKTYVKANPSKDISTDFEVMVNVYANKKGLAKTLAEAGYLSGEAELESFFRQFNQSQPLFHFIDCGYGKESADAKLRGESSNLRNALACSLAGHQSQASPPPLERGGRQLPF